MAIQQSASIFISLSYAFQSIETEYEDHTIANGYYSDI
jgi:hypothetical protein